MQIEHTPAYSPEARGRSERAFGTHQGRLPQELALLGITEQKTANTYLRDVYMPAFNKEFSRLARQEGSAFVSAAHLQIDTILCEQHERTVGGDNCVQFDSVYFQLPVDAHRCDYAKVKVKLYRFSPTSIAVYHGPCMLAYDDITTDAVIPTSKHLLSHALGNMPQHTTTKRTENTRRADSNNRSALPIQTRVHPLRGPKTS